MKLQRDVQDNPLFMLITQLSAIIRLLLSRSHADSAASENRFVVVHHYAMSVHYAEQQPLTSLQYM